MENNTKLIEEIKKDIHSIHKMIQESFNEYIKGLVEEINKNSIHEIDLVDSIHLKEEHIELLFQSLLNNDSVEFIDLSKDNIETSHLFDILKTLLEKNQKIEELYLDGWKFSHNQKEEIKKLCKSKKIECSLK